MRILLIEDDTMIADAVAGSLKDSGYAVDWINNGRTAVTAFGSQSYDLILLDLGLPGQDGLDVLQQLRGSGNPTPVLILTARKPASAPSCAANTNAPAPCLATAPSPSTPPPTK